VWFWVSSTFGAEPSPTEGPAPEPVPAEPAPPAPSVEPAPAAPEPEPPAPEPPPPGEPAPPPLPAAEDPLVLLGIVLDDRLTTEVRTEALGRVARTGDARMVPFLEAAADRADPALAPAVADAALSLGAPGGPEVVRRVLRVDGLPRVEVERLVGALGETPTPEAGTALWNLASDREVPARIRNLSSHTLLATHGDAIARLGPPPAVPDLLGGSLTLAAGATAGGVTLGAIGGMGDWDAGIPVGAIGGAVTGAGLAGLRLLAHPATTGEGLAAASGVAWGVTAGVWAGNVGYGSAQYVVWPRQDEVRAPRAGLLAVGTMGGATVGWWASRRHPTVVDVLEIDLAGYLAQGMTGGLVKLAFPTPQVETTPFGPTGGRPTGTVSTFVTTGSTGRFVEPFEDQRRGSQRYAAGELLGAAAGLGAGAVLVPRWELGLNDVAFAAVVGTEAAVLGATLPDVVGVDDDQLQGLFWFPSHAGALLGLSMAELLPSDPGRTLATGFGAGVGNALGAGIALAQGYDDERSVSTGAAPGGLLGTALGYAVEPLLDPSAGDAAMIGVSTGIVGTTGTLVGVGLAASGAWADPAQGVGLGLVSTGAAGIASWALVPVVEAEVDEALFVGSAATLGAMYGGLGTYALGGSDATAMFVAAGSEVAVTGLSAVLVSDAAGFDPRRALVPEVGAVSGATLGALGAALFSGESLDVAAGTVGGATVGLAAGVLVEVVAHPLGSRPVASLPALPAGLRVAPALRRSVDGAPLLSLSVDGW
jgi:hypothetical protein